MKNTKTEKKINSYLQKIATRKLLEKEREDNQGSQRPSAYYDIVPFARFYKSKAFLYITKFPEYKFFEDITNPLWNDSDENYITYRTHYFDKGIVGLNGRKSKYVNCEKSLEKTGRCALCEVYYAAWQMKIRHMEEETAEWQKEKDIAIKYRPSLRHIFATLSISQLMKDPPDCFGVDGELDIKAEKCISCAWQDSCFRKQIGVEIFSMSPTLKTKYESKLEELYGVSSDEDEETENKYDYEGEHTDPDNCVLFKLEKVKQKGDKYSYDIDIYKTGYELKDNWKTLLEDTFPAEEDIVKLFQPTHTYQQLLVGISEEYQELLQAHLDELGLDIPESEDKPAKKVKPKSKPINNDEDEESEDETDEDSDEKLEEKPRNASKQKGKETSKGLRKTNKDKDSDDEDQLEDTEEEEEKPEPQKLKICFADEDIYSFSSKKCQICPFFDTCGDVISEDLTKEEAIKLMKREGRLLIIKKKKESEDENAKSVRTKLSNMKKVQAEEEED